MSKNPFSIYIHIPFCQKKCPYCDFNSYATDAATLQSKEGKYIEALIKELAVKLEQYKMAERSCKSIFFGGGTPSLLSRESFSSILGYINNNVALTEDCEVTVEVNPKSVAEDYTSSKLIHLRTLGVNRVSMGSQSFNMQKLKFLGRWHTNEDVIKTVTLVKEAGIENFNLDLMFGVKNETLADWKVDVSSALALSPKHISAYMLTMEPGTEFGKRTKKGEVLISDEDTFVDLYEYTREALADAGFKQYEVSNYSLPGLECRHNVHYWEAGEYLGIGAGAHSFVKFSDTSGLRYSNTPSPDNYVSRITQGSDASQVIDEVSQKELLYEYVLFGLRMNRGISVSTHSIHYSERSLGELIAAGKLDHLFEGKYLIFESERLRVAANHMRFADEFSAEITALLP